jgi:hypothetical protein
MIHLTTNNPRNFSRHPETKMKENNEKCFFSEREKAFREMEDFRWKISQKIENILSTIDCETY